MAPKWSHLFTDQGNSRMHLIAVTSLRLHLAADIAVTLLLLLLLLHVRPISNDIETAS